MSTKFVSSPASSPCPSPQGTLIKKVSVPEPQKSQYAHPEMDRLSSKISPSEAGSKEKTTLKEREKSFLAVGTAIASRLGERTGLRQRLGIPTTDKTLKPSPSEFEEAELLEEDEEDRSEAEEERKRKGRGYQLFRFYWLKFGFRWLCPGSTPLLMMLGFFFTVVGLTIRRFTKGIDVTGAFTSYIIYLCVTAAIIVCWLLLRVMWMLFIYQHVLPENRYVVAMNAVLDPHLVYLLAAITVCLFWAYVPVAPSLQEFLKLTKLKEGGLDDLAVLLRVNLFMILWAIRNLALSVITFNFLTGFLMAFNTNLVKYLTLYSLIRRLNAAWVRLHPILAVQLSERQTFQRASDETISRGAEEKTFARLESKVENSVGMRQLLIRAKSGVMRDDSPTENVRSVDKINLMLSKVRKDNTESYHVESTGGSVPRLLKKKSIEGTKRSTLQNLLSIEYARQQPAVLFVKGERIEVTSKKIAKEAVVALFDEIIAFRDSLVPKGGQEERNKTARESILFLRREAEKDSKKKCRRVPVSVTSNAIKAFRKSSPSRENRDAVGSHRISGLGRTQTSPTTTESEKYPQRQSLPREQKAPTLENTPLPSVREGSDEKPNKQMKYKTLFRHSKNHETEVQFDLKSSNHSEVSSFQDDFNLDKHSQMAESRGSFVENENETNFGSLKSDNDSHAMDDSEICWENTKNDPRDSQNAPLNDNLVSKEYVDQELIRSVQLIERDAVHGESMKLNPSILKRTEYLTRDFIELFLGDQTDEFIKAVDLGGRGKISRINLCRAAVEAFQLREQLVHLVGSQQNIRKIVNRMISIFLGFIILLIFLLMIGVSADVIIISGAAVLSSVTVILSTYALLWLSAFIGFFYTNFIESVIFICFLNPYNVGDRIRIANLDEIHIVKSINTYFTEFVTMTGKPETFNHTALFHKPIMNESRNQNASLEIPVVIDFYTPQSKYEHLHYQVEQFVQTSQEFVKDSFALILGDVEIGHFIKFTYWLSTVESWGNWKAVGKTRSLLLKFITKECELLKIHYMLPVKPIYPVEEYLGSSQY